jgi:hypothetical protein
MIHFDRKEFYCPCGCGLNYNHMDSDLLDMLDRARGYAEVSFVINSSIRCAEHNKIVGGSTTSSHLTGRAVDIKCISSYARHQTLIGLIRAGFNRFGLADIFIHADVDSDKPKNLCWVY